ncbi:MAG TPA: metallophosphoesterase family protein [Verrucomicrobiae bacterium]|nr:metallophosphoesterase family protein [Verrucomicrobiae bacterium]
MKIGVISDTHNVFDPRIPGLFHGVEHILHAGDIGLPHILRQLEAIAPVTAVGGNTDEAAFRYRQTEIVSLAGHKFLIHHIVSPHALSEELQSRISIEKPDVVVFGHTHKAFCERIGSILFFNPGSAGKSRFGLPRSAGILRCNAQEIRTEFLALD